MRLPFLPSLTRLAWVAVAALSVLLLVDSGALMLSRMATPDRARDAGHAAALAVEGHVVSQQTAVLAYDAARAAASEHALRISTEDFRVLPGGRIRLTASRTAPTLLIHRLPLLRDYVDVSVTQTVEPLPYRSASP